MNSIFGLQIIKSDVLTKGFSDMPKRIHKKKRIQKKWIKKYGYKIIPDPNIYQFDGKIIGHSLTINKILKSIKNQDANKVKC